MTTLELLKVTKAVWGSIRDASPEEKNRILLAMADALQQETDSILAANEQDMDKARGGISEVMLDRLRLDPARIDGMADGIRATVKLPDHTGRIISETVHANGMHICKKQVPLGLVAIIYESRPNVTSDAAALAIKSGNVCMLRSGKEAFNSCHAIVKALKKGIAAAGGNPNKFVGGCCAEGKLAARGAIAYMKDLELPPLDMAAVEREKARVYAPLLARDEDGVRPVEMKERLQRLMDEYAGGVSQFYRTNEERLDYALKHIARLQSQFGYLRARDLHELMQAHETMDRVDVAEAVVHHLKARKETRWAGWQTRSDYPERDDARFDCFIESRRDPATGKVETFTRPYEQLIPGDRYTA